jgi:hypothetical protein
MKSIFYKPIFWVAFFAASLASALLTIHYFPQAHSIINVPITMDRQEAIAQATRVVQQHALQPADGHTATNFQTDYLVQFFVELEAGGKDAFIEMIDKNLYQPYTWQVRFFKEHMPEEAIISFTPEGKLYEFQQKFSENAPGAQLTSQQAQIIAEQGAIEWTVDLSVYKLIETSKETVPSGRIDHTFVYQRPDVKIGEGFYRLRIKVAGDKLSELSYFVQVPESFIRKYTEMRSANDTIAYYAKIVLMLLYFLGGCIFALLFLIRRRYVLWRAPIIWGIIFVLLMIGSGLNQIPLAWMQYDTAISSNGYLLQYIMSIIINSFMYGLFFTIIFAAAESLTRAAFGNQIQLWNIWNNGVANSYQVIGRTLGAYLLVPLDLLFATIFYLVMSNYFGWWNPSSSLFDPNILATQLPWFDAISQSVRAGFWEECMFRAIPLSAAALLGTRFGKRNWWIGGALILQAIVFGAGHANYPAQPAIARVIELFLPSLIWGGLYLAFGLLLVIVMHILYDLLLFSLPLFLATGYHAHAYQGIIIFCSLIPIWIILLRRLQTGSFISLPAWAFNRAWQAPDEMPVDAPQSQPQIVTHLGSQIKIGVIAAGILGLGTWYFATPHTQQAAPMEVDRTTALHIAQKTFAQSGIDQKKPWNALPTAFTTFENNPNNTYQHRFIWQQGKSPLYQKLLGTYLKAPYWRIRFAQFEGSSINRAEEIAIDVNNQANTFHIMHHLPEAQAGKELTEQEARMIAHAELKNKFGLEAEELKELSAVATKRPGRMDWTFTFANENASPLSQGQLRIGIEISGNQLTDYSQYVHVPEEWLRQEKNNENMRTIIMLICLALIYLLFCAGSFFAALGWTNNLLLGKSFLIFFGAIFILEFFDLFNGYTNTIATTFNTSQPFQDQFIRTFGSLAFKAFLATALYALLIAYINRFKIPTRLARTGFNGALGLSIGIFFASMQALLLSLIPSQKPVWANYSSMLLWSPLLGSISHTIINFITLTLLGLLLFVIIDSLTRHGRTRITAACSIFLIFGLAISGIQFADNPQLFITFGILTGTICFGAYYLIMRLDPAVIPLAVAGYMSLHLAQECMYQALPSATFSSAISIGLVLILSWWWYKKLN